MNIMKKLTASILIICMFLRLPESEAMASEATNEFINATTSIDYPINDFRHNEPAAKQRLNSTSYQGYCTPGWL